MVRQRHLIAVVRAFLIGCAFLLLIVGCAGTSSETSNEKEQGSSPKATESEEARCEGTRTFHAWYVVYPNGQNTPLQTGSAEDMKKAGKVEGARVYTTNDLPGCPKGGLLLGNDKPDALDGKEGDDVVRGLAGSDLELAGGPGSDILYGGAGDDESNTAQGQGKREDVLYGGDGNDLLDDYDGYRGKLYCGKGKDGVLPDKKDYVDSSCEKKMPGGGGA